MLPTKVDDCIVSAAIYPPIGVARVGNSEEGFFVGPEVPDPPPLDPGSYRDADGKLKRQAARFRVYGLNAAGQAVAELNASNAEVRWTVHLANTKATAGCCGSPSTWPRSPETSSTGRTTRSPR